MAVSPPFGPMRLALFIGCVFAWSLPAFAADPAPATPAKKTDKKADKKADDKKKKDAPAEKADTAPTATPSPSGTAAKSGSDAKSDVAPAKPPATRYFEGMGHTPEEQKQLEELSQALKLYEDESHEFKREVQLLVEKKYEEKRNTARQLVREGHSRSRGARA